VSEEEEVCDESPEFMFLEDESGVEVYGEGSDELCVRVCVCVCMRVGGRRGWEMMGSISRVKPCNRTKCRLFGRFTSICILTAAFSFRKGR